MFVSMNIFEIYSIILYVFIHFLWIFIYTFMMINFISYGNIEW